MTERERRALALLEELLDDSVSPDAILANLDVDSLTILEWVFAIEEEFGIALDETRVQGIERETEIGTVITRLVS